MMDMDAQNWPRRKTTICRASGVVTILQPLYRRNSISTSPPARVRARTHLGRYPSGPEQARVLVHVERDATGADGVGRERAGAEVMDEAEGGDDEGCGARELGATLGGGVVST